FFLQAEDGIRDFHVTGVQTCALPISRENASFDVLMRAFKASVMARNLDLGSVYTTKSLTYAQRILRLNQDDPEVNFWFGFGLSRSEERRVGIEIMTRRCGQIRKLGTI